MTKVKSLQIYLLKKIQGSFMLYECQRQIKKIGTGFVNALNPPAFVWDCLASMETETVRDVINSLGMSSDPCSTLCLLLAIQTHHRYDHLLPLLKPLLMARNWSIEMWIFMASVCNCQCYWPLRSCLIVVWLLIVHGRY